MQQPECFGKKKDEERDARLERLDQKFSEKVASLQGVFDRVSNIEKDFDFLKEEVRNIKARHEDLSESLNGTSAILHTNLDNFKERIDIFGSNLTTIGRKIDHHSIEHQAKDPSIANQVNSIQSKVNSLNVDEKVESQKKYTTVIADEIRNQICKLEDKIKEHAINFKETNSSIINLLFNLSNVNNKIDCALADSEKCNSNLLIASNSINEKINNLSDNLAIALNGFSEKYKSQTIDIDFIISKVKEQIKEYITNITADSQNASLKYNNIAADIALLSKKLENAQLIIKKLEQSKLT